MLANRSCAKLGRGNTKPQGINPPHYLTLLSIPSDCPVILSQGPAGVHRDCCSTGRDLSWNCYGHRERALGHGLQQRKNINVGMCSVYLSSQNSASGHGNSAMDLETNFPELTDLNRAPAPFLYLVMSKSWIIPDNPKS